MSGKTICTPTFNDGDLKSGSIMSANSDIDSNVNDGVDSQVTVTNSVTGYSGDQNRDLKPLTPTVDSDNQTEVTATYGTLIELTPSHAEGSSADKVNEVDDTTTDSNEEQPDERSSQKELKLSPTLLGLPSENVRLSFEVENKIIELVTHETTYVQSLKSLYNSYIVKISEDFSVEKPYMFYVVKESTEQIKRTHSRFLKEMLFIFKDHMKIFYLNNLNGESLIAKSFQDFVNNRTRMEEFEYFHNISNLIMNRLLTDKNLTNYLYHSFLATSFLKYLNSIKAQKIYIAANCVEIRADYSVKRSKRNEVNRGFSDVKIDTSLSTLISKPFHHIIHLKNIYSELKSKIKSNFQYYDDREHKLLLQTVELTYDKLCLFLDNLNSGMSKFAKMNEQKKCFKESIMNLSYRNKLVNNLFQIIVPNDEYNHNNNKSFVYDNLGQLVLTGSCCVIYKNITESLNYKNLGLVLFDNYLMVIDCFNLQHYEIKFCIPLFSVVDFWKDDDKFYENGEITTHYEYKFKLLIRNDKQLEYELVFLFETWSSFDNWVEKFELSLRKNGNYKKMILSNIEGTLDDYSIGLFGFEDVLPIRCNVDDSTIAITHINIAGDNKSNGLNEVDLGDFDIVKTLIEYLIIPKRKVIRSTSDSNITARLSLRKMGSLNSLVSLLKLDDPKLESTAPSSKSSSRLSSSPSILETPSNPAPRLKKRTSFMKKIKKSFSYMNLSNIREEF